MDLKFTSNCFPSSHHFASCFAVYPWITYPRRAWVLDSFKCLNENSARFHVWIHLLFLGTVWSFKHWTCYWVHVCVLNTQWGPTNWDVRVWSRESIVAGPSEENRWLVLKKLPDFPKGFSKALKKKKNCIGVQPINNAVIISGEQWRDSARHTHVSMLLQTRLPSRLPHNTEQSSLC